jgi:hypothetical protein
MKRSLITSLFACSLASSGCAVVDQFDDRAVAYNIQGERARNQFLLLNVIRSAYRKPMQFSVLTTVTGTATVTGGVSSVLPLGGPASLYQLNPSSDVSGGPTFTVANQVDKEFYQGILTPVEMETVDSLFQAGYPKQLLLTLFVSKISFARADQEPRINRPDQRYFPDFQEMINELVNEGITTEAFKSSDEIGPPLTRSQAAQMEGISKLKAQGLDLERTKALSGKSLTYQISKSKTEYRFCFDTVHHDPCYDWDLHAKLLTRISQSALDAHACGKAQDEVECDDEAQFGRHRSCNSAGKATRPEGFNVAIRSTLAIIYYLGEISRGTLGLADGDFEEPTLLFRDRRMRCSSKPNRVFSLFRATGDPALTVSYEGTDYSVPLDPSGRRDHSTQVLDLVEQLAALNSSNKNLPSSSVVNLVGH